MSSLSLDVLLRLPETEERVLPEQLTVQDLSRWRGAEAEPHPRVEEVMEDGLSGGQFHQKHRGGVLEFRIS